MVGTNLYTFLSAQASITALVSTRIYPVKLPQGVTFPCLSYQLISEPRDYTLDKVSVPNATVQFDCWGKTYLEANQLGDALVNVLDAYTGVVGSLTFLGCIQRARRDIYENETNEFRASIDYSFMYK